MTPNIIINLLFICMLITIYGTFLFTGYELFATFGGVEKKIIKKKIYGVDMQQAVNKLITPSSNFAEGGWSCAFFF